MNDLFVNIWLLFWIIGGNIWWFSIYKDGVIDVYLFRDNKLLGITLWALDILGIYLIIDIIKGSV